MKKSAIVDQYRKASEQGYADAQYNLALCYAKGEGVAKDLSEAVKLYIKAAQQGYAKAQNNLGWCYAKGEGIAKDKYEAVKWFRKSAEQGHAEAQYNLGTCYEYGEGVAEDNVEAVKWYRKAANNGHPKAGLYIGRCCKTRDVVAKKIKKAKSRPGADELIAELNGLIGIQKVKKDVTDIINLIKIRKEREERGMQNTAMSLHLVFTGNPGTGKTTVARLLAKIYHALGLLSEGHFVEVDRSGLIGQYLGQTAAKVLEVISRAMGGVLFIDEAYALTPELHDQYGKEAIETLLKAMEDNRNDLIVIVAGYPDLMDKFLESNPGLRSRFNKFILYEDYSANELQKILINMVTNLKFLLTKEAEDYALLFFKKRLSLKLENYANARDVRNFFEKAMTNQANRLSSLNINKMSDKDLATIALADIENIEL